VYPGKRVAMSAQKLSGSLPFAVPDDLPERAGEITRRVEADEAMTMQYIADSLGLPFDFVAVAIGLSYALKSGQPVVIDPAQLPKPN
jgi:hypothetical protein